MPASEGPPAVASARGALAERVADAPGLLLALDFDGTLAPIVEEPDRAAMAEACRGPVAALADAPDVTLAVVSGRALADVRERVGLDGVAYAGNHGLERQRGGEAEVHPEAAAEADAIDDVCASVAEAVESVPGAVVENKDVTATVHYRQAPDDAVEAVRDAVEEAVAAVDADLEVLPGKQIREIRPDVAWDKGRAVAELRADVPGDWLAVYVGDDATDEDAIEVVEPEGIGVRVGDETDTAASYRIPDQEGVAAFLELVREARAD